MNLLDKITPTEEMIMLIELKYGKPDHSREYLDKLPDVVVNVVCHNIAPKIRT